MKKIIAICLLSAITSCGRDGSSDSTPQIVNQDLEAQKAEGNYRAIIRPINTSLSGWIPSGMAVVKILNDEIEVETWLEDSAPTIHHQNIHLGSDCPLNNDKNKDGYVDVREMIPTTKEILIPLDNQLDSVAIGAGYYPTGKSYRYSEKGSWTKIVGQLNPSIISSKNPFKLDGKIIMIHGASPLKELPASVGSIEGKKPQETIPIACGVLERIEASEEGPL